MKNTIKVERARNDLTQSDLAERLAVSRQTINSIEKGKYIPSTKLALRMARVFRVRVEDLFILEDSEKYDL